MTEGIGTPTIWKDLKQQIFLGDDGFVERMRSEIPLPGDPRTVPSPQRRNPVPSLVAIADAHADRDAAIAAAHSTGRYGYREIAAYFGVHPSRIGRVVRNVFRQRQD